MKPEAKKFRYFAKVLDSGDYVIREATGFEANPEDKIIFALYYDDRYKTVIKESIYLATDEKDLLDTLKIAAQCYANNPDDIVSFIDEE